MAKRYAVQVTRVDYGTYTAVFNTVKQATACATLNAFSFAGHAGSIAAGRSFIEIKRKDCQRVSYEPSSKAWSISIAKL